MDVLFDSDFWINPDRIPSSNRLGFNSYPTHRLRGKPLLILTSQSHGLAVTTFGIKGGIRVRLIKIDARSVGRELLAGILVPCP